MGAPTSSYATAGIALRVSGAVKPHHQDKVETPSVGYTRAAVRKYELSSNNKWSLKKTERHEAHNMSDSGDYLDFNVA
jgi:hypothetical protein